jgi:hypothetical protein
VDGLTARLANDEAYMSMGNVHLKLDVMQDEHAALLERAQESWRADALRMRQEMEEQVSARTVLECRVSNMANSDTRPRPYRETVPPD